MGQRAKPLPPADRLRARKGLGQHWLVDPVLRERVVAAAGIEPADEVLEIGAGPGTLTADLVRLARRVVAVELDARLLPRLRAAAPGAEIVNADVLEVDPAALFPAGGEVVVGNIPYYLTGALVPHLLDRTPRPKRLSLVVQREVARRWCGLEGWSLATVAVQTFSRPRIAFELPPEAFVPPPRVTSALAVLEVRPEPAVGVPDLGAFFRFVEAVFQFRRKQLRAALARVCGLSGEQAGALLEAAGVEPARRAETLSLAEWEATFRRCGPKTSGPIGPGSKLS
jgi:16S rRNA (adenine1518-N6/adenine1519-N6)-dimethyltransferase